VVIYKSLHSWLRDAHREMRYIYKIEPMNTFKNFSKDGYRELKAYEVYWINEHSKTKEYDYLGGGYTFKVSWKMVYSWIVTR